MGLRLHHIHLPALAPSYYPPYTLAERVQDALRRQLLAHKDLLRRPPSAPPPPTLLSFTPLPTYTLGRRQTTPLPARELARLRAPLLPHHHRPAVLRSPRGGLVTYHGPGQAVLWPVLDLRGAATRPLTVRCYAALLEATTAAVLGARCGVRGAHAAEGAPGVWVPPPSGGAGRARKIAALGVHLRRHVTGLGTAVNVDFGGPAGGDPWKRIVACGLEGREVTSVRAVVGEGPWREWVGGLPSAGGGGEAVADGVERAVAAWWAEELARRIGLEGVAEQALSRAEVVRMLETDEDGVAGGRTATAEEMEYVARVFGPGA
ncbi:hypothetical protein P8C59_009471 [Phyllachora maydis]|uniref:BPL/LPL catalytic domain-containing protein n=1 Tax=Phyllachora maydis TaxID=1825666 RepID=A0AAD9ICQ1_9PEZI|nr:hypothetical protein P8C59_009471 [Phyllachora maydis]